MPGKPSLIRSLCRLRWWAPPHGASGLGALALGLYITLQTLSGSFSAVHSPAVLLAYVALMTMNASVGFAMASRAPLAMQTAFRCSAAFQVCLVYFVWRFSPPCAAIVWLQPPQALDVAFAIALVLGILSFAVPAATLPRPIAVSIFIGIFALLLLAAYPIQLAYGGDTWWRCVRSAYPMQAAGMVACIYVPAATAFSAMLFGATLWLRKLIGALSFGGGFSGVILATLVATVLMQEVHIPYVSTQKIYIPCPAPPPGSLAARVEIALNVSALAQSALGMMR